MPKMTMERVKLIFAYCLWMGKLKFTKTFDIMLNFVW